MLRTHLLPLLVVLPVACAKSEPTRAAPSASASEAAETPPPEPPSPPPAPVDVDTAGITRDLGCDGKAPKSKRACTILKEFIGASRWDPKAPSGMSRYVGHSYAIEQGAEKDTVIVFVGKVVPTAQVPAGYLPLVVGMDPLPKELVNHGIKLTAALAREGAPSVHNQAMPWIEKHDPSKTYEVATTSGASVHLVAQDSIYVREVDRHKIVVVSPSRARDAAPGDGTYSELLLASW